MIPLKLQLKNFISYGPQVQTINFEPYSLICLSGKNGHGKSALLDALTWALWGQARKNTNPGKADEGLLRLGQTHMMVALDFHYNRVHYRVRREYTIVGGKALSHLDFGIVDPQSQHLRPLTEKTIRGTQEKINQVLCLDYESFTNSAFLRQGQSNEFSKKSARERKEVLARILGLERYEQLRKKATDKVRTLTQEKEHRLQQQQALQTELQAQESIHVQLEDLTKALHALQLQEQELYQALHTFERESRALESQRQAYTKLCVTSDHYTKTIDDTLTLLRNKVSTWKTIQREQKNLHHAQATTQETAILEKRLQEVQKALKDHRNTVAAVAQDKILLADIKEKQLKEHSARIQEYTRLQGMHNTHYAQLREQCNTHAQKQKAILEEQNLLAKEIAKIQESSVLLPELTKKIEHEEKLFERRKTFYHKFIMRGNLLKKEAKELLTKKELVSTVQAQCPLCTQSLPLALSTNLNSSFIKKQSLIDHHITRIAKVLQALKDTLAKQHHLLELLKQELQAHIKASMRLEELKKQYLKYNADLQEERKTEHDTLKSLQEAEQLLLVHKNNPVTPFESYLVAHTPYVTLLKHIEEQEVLITKNSSLEAEHDEVSTRLAFLTQESQKQQNLLVQVALQAERKHEIHELCVRIRALKLEKSKVAQELEHYKVYETTLKNLEERIQEREQDLKACTAQKEILLQKQGALLHHKKMLEAKQEEAQTLVQRIKELDDLAHQYQALGQAFSKDGIQALLIEEAIPEIEHEANILLAKLTDNQAHLIIESVRDLKSGATKETLDIKISDALGIRSYELFSGGEAFRIDFALRIAISKLLARRAGAALQMLIIDEGFGSQDEEGLAHITDVLYKIQEEFNKVIIVSHLPSMKDQFPVQFFVYKHPQGSTVTVMEQG